MSEKMKQIIGAVIGVLILLALYVLFLKPDNEQTVVVREEGAAGSTVSSELLTLLNTLKTIHFDTSLFESSAYRSLIDFSVTISPQPVGRPNPFAPIGVDSGNLPGGLSGGSGGGDESGTDE